VARPKGTAINTAPIVTKKEPISSGSSPNMSSIGYQRRLNRSLRGTSKKVGNPSLTKKKKIRAMITIAETPAICTSDSMIVSRQLRLLACFSSGVMASVIGVFPQKSD
jgi:hypothetical protein